jgi:hypothetical protein
MTTRYSIRTALLVIVVLAIFIAATRDPIVRLLRSNSISWKLIETTEDLDRLLGNSHAFVFVNADWSSTSAVARRNAEEFVVDWRCGRVNSQVDFFMIDISNGSPIWLTEWIQTNEKLASIQHAGDGSSLWIQDGEIIERSARLDSSNELRKKTIEIFNMGSN